MHTETELDTVRRCRHRARGPEEHGGGRAAADAGARGAAAAAGGRALPAPAPPPVRALALRLLTGCNVGGALVCAGDKCRFEVSEQFLLPHLRKRVR